MLVEDNALPHTAEAREIAKNLRSYTRVEFSPYSSDLNPIENVWHILKQNIYPKRKYAAEENWGITGSHSEGME
jgi:transposase